MPRVFEKKSTNKKPPAFQILLVASTFDPPQNSGSNHARAAGLQMPSEQPLSAASIVYECLYDVR